MKDFAARLLDWFDRHGRHDLPWQQQKTPYRVWISEIMLQQTQVSTVIPYYERFMARFPSVDTLAAASQDEVLHLWTGLGYYARARNLHKTAQRIVAQYNGEFPGTQSELEELPGIGRSTAAAIIAICSNQRAAILDGNVKRVLARVFAIEGWPGQTATSKALWQIAETLTPETRVADYTQAIMDLGATLCTRSKPSCEVCPFNHDCQAQQLGRIADFPGKKPRKALPVRETVMLLIEHDGSLLLQQRPTEGLWGGLYGLPECSDHANVAATLARLSISALAQQPLEPFRHTFTHFHLDITPLQITAAGRANQIAATDDYLWYDPDQPLEIGLTKPATRLIHSKIGQ